MLVETQKERVMNRIHSKKEPRFGLKPVGAFTNIRVRDNFPFYKINKLTLDIEQACYLQF